MSTAKVSVTLDDDVLAEARRIASGSRQLSAYVNEAVRQANQRHLIMEHLRESEERSGPVPRKFVDEALAAWPDAE